MGRPGNKRLQRALYGAAPSSAATSLTTEGEGRYAVTRVTGSVINNGGNMRSGGYPRVGMGLAFLRKTRCNTNCDSFVGTDEDLVVVPTPLERATTYNTAFDNNAQITLVNTAATALQNANTDADSASTAADIASTTASKADALVDYNDKKAVLDAMNAKKSAAENYVNYPTTALYLEAWLAAE